MKTNSTFKLKRNINIKIWDTKYDLIKCSVYDKTKVNSKIRTKINREISYTRIFVSIDNIYSYIIFDVQKNAFKRRKKK